MDKGELLEPGELLIDNGRIVDVAPTSVPSDAAVIDLGDLTLLPGSWTWRSTSSSAAPITRAR